MLVFLHRPAPGGVEFLVLHRVDGGYWHGLAGGIELGESAEEAALREVLEESALDVSATLRSTAHEFVYSVAEEPDRIAKLASDTTHVHVTCFEAAVPGGCEPELNEEHDGYRWCRLAEAAALFHWDDAREALLLAGAGVAA